MDSKFNEEAFEFINGVRREHEEELCYDANSREAMINELVGAARRVEMEKSERRGVYEKVPIEAHCHYSGRAPVRFQMGGREQWR